MEAEIDSVLSQLRAGAEAVQHAGEPGPLPLFAQNPHRVVLGVAGMDDHRHVQFQRGADMAAECFLLQCAWAVVVIIIEPGLTDGNNLRISTHLHQAGGGDVRLLLRAMRMGAERAGDVVMRLGDRQDLGKAVDPGRDRQEMPDPGGAGAVDHRLLFGREIGEFQMAVAVDEHVRAYSASTILGNRPCGGGKAVPGTRRPASPRAAKSRLSAGTAS